MSHGTYLCERGMDVMVLVRITCLAVSCSVLQCVAVRCSALQCVAVCCSVLQCVANMNKSHMNEFGRVGVNKWTSVVQCVVVCCSVLQCVAVYQYSRNASK